MAWSNSKIFSAFVRGALANTSAYDLDLPDAFKAALFADSITPANNVSQANSAYGAGVWASGGVFDASGWPAVGRPLVTPTLSAETVTTVKFDADDTVSANDTTTLSACYGTLVYDDDVSDYGLCYNYFGGAASVTSGRFTIVWNSSGIFTISVA